jgi:ABC-type multidrug transport system permease subunit
MVSPRSVSATYFSSRFSICSCCLGLGFVISIIQINAAGDVCNVFFMLVMIMMAGLFTPIAVCGWAKVIEDSIHEVFIEICDVYLKGSGLAILQDKDSFA